MTPREDQPTVCDYAPGPAASEARLLRLCSAAIVLASLCLVTTVGFRLAIRFCGYSMFDLWGSGRYRPIAPAAQNLAVIGYWLMTVSQYTIAFLTIAGVVLLSFVFHLDDGRSRHRLYVAFAILLISGCTCLQTHFYLLGA